MANDELEEINGIKPKVWLPDGEEREVSSQTRYYTTAHSEHVDVTNFPSFLFYYSNSVYKVKRTFDHYYW